MKRNLSLFAIIILAFSVSFIGKRIFTGVNPEIVPNPAKPCSSNPAPDKYNRIISLAPSITEILFMLGMGDKIVGVTRYCDYPPEAVKETKIGGYCNPNYELIVDLTPDLVVLLQEHLEQKKYLTKLGLNILMVNNQTISGILNAFISIGKTCNREQKAREVVADIQSRINRIKDKTKGLPRPRVMISIGRTMGSGSLKDVYIAGKNGFYDEMIALAGGSNVYEGTSITFPVLSAEGILILNPEIIIDMISDLEEKGLSEQMILKEWDSVSKVEAVKNKRVYVFGQGYVVIPGPRFILILEALARAIHPEIGWE
jgi:iron complex transport system substrate-binding protein